MRPWLEVGAPAARRLLAALPPQGPASASAYTVEQRGHDLVFSQRPAARAPCVAGPYRLRELRHLAQYATGLRVWARPGDGPRPSAWELQLPGARVWLLLSQSVPRGFSGDGQALEALADTALVAEANALRTRLDGRDPGVARVGELLAVLGSQGLVGRDLVEDGWFRRDLPFAAELIPRLQPRVRGAAEIADADLSARRLPGGASEVFVRSGTIEHRVLRDGADASCTCLWYTRHGGSRGPAGTSWPRVVSLGRSSP
jgi:hypothetical protein